MIHYHPLLAVGWSAIFNFLSIQLPRSVLPWQHRWWTRNFDEVLLSGGPAAVSDVIKSWFDPIKTWLNHDETWLFLIKTWFLHTHAMFKCAIRMIQLEFSTTFHVQFWEKIDCPFWSHRNRTLDFRVPYMIGLRFQPIPRQKLEFVWGPNKRTKLNMQYSCNRKKVVLFFNYNHNPFRLVQHTIEKSWKIILGYINWGTLHDTNTACGMTGSTTFGIGFQPTSPEKLPSMTLTIRAYWRLIYQQPRSWGLNIAIETSWTRYCTRAFRSLSSRTCSPKISPAAYCLACGWATSPTYCADIVGDLVLKLRPLGRFWGLMLRYFVGILGHKTHGSPSANLNTFR